MTALWHYTCDHGHEDIGARLVPGTWLQPGRRMPWTSRVVWLTDMAVPDRDALGLTMHIAACDRTVHRYRVTDDSAVVRYVEWAREALYRLQREQVENVPGALPMHWWVSDEPVSVEYDPIARRVASPDVP